MLEHVNCSTPDLATETARKLATLLPECAGENGEIDLDKLRQCLSSKAVEGNVERYRFEWPGKRAAMAAASAATAKTLRPCRAESVDYDTTGNLYIEGDNLEVLKLLQTSYAGKVKMIYIDPPYNTGHDFVYRDRFSLTQKELDSQTGAFDEDGNRFEVNDSAEARYHSNWCSMMWPRLKLARNLLRDDGVIFISIDDNEVTNLRKLCDEIFGERNFVVSLIWEKKFAPQNDDKYITPVHDYILVYAKTKENWSPKLQERTDAALDKFKNPDNDPRGVWTSGDMTSKTKAAGHSYPIESPTGKTFYPPEGRQWAAAYDTYLKLKEENRLWFGEDGNNVPRLKQFLSEIQTGVVPVSLLPYSAFGHNQEAKKELIALIPGIGNSFETPKPSRLMIGLLKLVKMETNDIVLDFFSGSATSAHAVMQLNAEDGGNRKFIMVQLPEPCAEDSEAAKAGYANICEIGKERIRRAGKKIAEELAAKNAEIVKENAQTELALDNPGNPVNPVEKEIPDIGFRVLKLDSSSLIDAGVTTGEAVQGTLALSRIRDDRSPEDLLFQVLLETRIPLSDSITTAKVGGNEVFFVGGTGEGAPLIACLDPKARMDSQLFIEVAKLKPGLAFFRDDAFADDSARTNLQQVFNQFSPTTSVKVI